MSPLDCCPEVAQVTEGAVLEGRHGKTAEAKCHTLADPIDRYLREVLPSKSPSSIYMQTLQLNEAYPDVNRRTPAP